jgi:GNAT superfamily N-acetyltransferase
LASLAKSEWRGHELNEVEWWAKWAELEWVGRGCYAFFSKKFREPFFNRAGFLEVPQNLEGLVEALEKRFAERRVGPRVLVQETPGWRPVGEFLARRGYRVVDSMSVMHAGRGALVPNPEVDVEVSTRALVEWSRTYLRAFYGRTVLMPAVKSILKEAMVDKRVSLLIARIGRDAVGCGAVYRTEGVLGAYCIGTVPESRRRNVGSTVLGAITELARRERRKVVLQAMLSDSAEDFYLRNGFNRVYIKSVFERV